MLARGTIIDGNLIMEYESNGKTELKVVKLSRK